MPGDDFRQRCNTPMKGNFNHVQFTLNTPVPEPASIAILFDLAGWPNTDYMSGVVDLAHGVSCMMAAMSVVVSPTL